MRLFDFLKGKKKPNRLGYDPAEIVDKLEVLGYMKYAAPTDIDEIRKELLDSLAINHLGCSFIDDAPYHSKDFRHYLFDGEDLFEEGGFIDQLNDMKELFKKMNFKLEITNHIEDWDNERGLNHNITLNGKEYIIFKNFDDYGWGEAAQRFAEIINDQLSIQKINERIYLINGGNDGRAVYLSDQQFELLDPILLGNDRPLKLADWCRVHQVDTSNYCQP